MYFRWIITPATPQANHTHYPTERRRKYECPLGIAHFNLLFKRRQEMIISTSSVQRMGVIYAKTLTAEYFMLMVAPRVANVFRKSNDKEFCICLGKRKLPERLTENDGFTFLDGSDEPVAAIIPIEIGIRTLGDIPLQGCTPLLEERRI